MKTLEERQNLMGETVYTFTAKPDADAEIKASLLLVHGLGEYCRRYDHVIRAMTDAGIAVTAFDHIGHGRTSGKRGVYRYATAWQLIRHFQGKLLMSEPSLPFFLYGHSLGGALVLTYAQRFPADIRGVVASSPGLGTVPPYPNWLTAVVGSLGRTFPKLTTPNFLPPGNLYHGAGEDKIYTNDPLVHGVLSLSLAHDLITLGRDMVERDDPFPVPLLLLQGGADRCVDPEMTARFAKKTGNEKIEFVAYPDGYHELHNEPFLKEDVIRRVTDWIVERSEHPAARK